MRRIAVLAAVLMGTAAVASAPDLSLRPPPKIAAQQPVAPEAPPAVADGTVAPSAEQDTRRGGFFASLRPVFRSPRAARTAPATLPSGPVAGSVCGDPAIQGSVIGQVTGNISGCGLSDAVGITSVSGVQLSTKSTMDCTTAKALKTWIDTSARPALAGKGGGLRRIEVAAHYACRRRNNAKTGRLSEHANGRAIDISGFVLANGSSISVLRGWNAGSSSRALQRMHAEACGPFGTVLGPRANRFHLDHFHFDTMRHRNGTFCR